MELIKKREEETRVESLENVTCNDPSRLATFEASGGNGERRVPPKVRPINCTTESLGHLNGATVVNLELLILF